MRTSQIAAAASVAGERATLHGLTLVERPTRAWRRAWPSFARSRSGMAAVEFAFVLPIMLVLWLGLTEVTQMVAADRKAALLTRTLADLTTQSTAVNDADLDTIFGAAAAVLKPFPAQQVSMRITSYEVDSAGTAFVDWSSSKTLNPPPTGAFADLSRCTTDSTIAAALRTANKPLVRAEVVLEHNPIFGMPRLPTNGSFSVETQSISLSDELFMRPRQGSKITKDGVATTPCPGFAT